MGGPEPRVLQTLTFFTQAESFGLPDLVDARKILEDGAASQLRLRAYREGYEVRGRIHFTHFDLADPVQIDALRQQCGFAAMSDPKAQESRIAVLAVANGFLDHMAVTANDLA